MVTFWQTATHSVISVWNGPLCISMLHWCTTIAYKAVKSFSEFWIWIWWCCQGFCFNLPLLHFCKTFFSFKYWAGMSIQLLTCTSLGSALQMWCQRNILVSSPNTIKSTINNTIITIYKSLLFETSGKTDAWENALKFSWIK